MLRKARWSSSGRSRVAMTTLTEGQRTAGWGVRRCRAAGPGHMAPEQLLEVAVVPGELLLQPLAGLRCDAGGGLEVVPLAAVQGGRR